MQRLRRLRRKLSSKRARPRRFVIPVPNYFPTLFGWIQLEEHVMAGMTFKCVDISVQYCGG